MTAEPSSEALDLLLDGPGGDGLVDGPFQGTDEPGVARQGLWASGVDFRDPGVDAFGEVVGDPQLDTFRHRKHASTSIHASTSDSVFHMMKTRLLPADQICQGITLIPPGKKQPVLVLNYFDNGGQIDVYCEGRNGFSVFIISRYAQIECVPTYADRKAS